MSGKTISVIIPVYNGEKYLRRTLDKLLEQSYPLFEAIMVNDGSTDGSAAILEEYTARDKRIKVLSKSNEGSAGKSVKFGLEYATGDYMMYSSQDDLYSPDLLEKNIAVAEATGAQAVIPDMGLYYDRDRIVYHRGLGGDRSRILGGREAFELSLDWRIHGFVMWSMEVVRRVGWFDFCLNSDEYTTRMLYLNCGKAAFSDGVFYYFQGNDQAITKKWNPALLTSLETTDRLEEDIIANGFPREALMRNRRNYVYEYLRIMLIFKGAAPAMTPRERKQHLSQIKHNYKKHIPRIRSVKGVGPKRCIGTYNWLLFNALTTMSAMFKSLGR